MNPLGIVPVKFKERQVMSEGGLVLAAAAALLSGLLLRIFFVVRFPRTTGDPMVYMDFARTLLERHVYGYSQTVAGVVTAHPSLIRLPGYPLFLAACFVCFGHGNVHAVLLVQVFVDLLTCGLMALTASRLFSARAGWFTLWLAVLCPFTAGYTAAPLTETLVLLTISLAFYGLVRFGQARGRTLPWLLLMAAALAYSILLRPDQGLLAVAVMPAIVWLSPGAGMARLRPALLVSVLTLIPLVPWTIRNEWTMHVFQPLAPRSATDPGEIAPDGFNRWYRTWGMDYATNETAYWAYNSDPILMGNLPDRAFDSAAQRSETERLLEEYNDTTTETPAFDARFAALAGERIQGHWMRYYVWLPSVRVLDMLFRPRTELLPVHDDWWRPHRHGWASTLWVAGICGGLNLVYMLLACAGWVRRRTLALEPTMATAVIWSMLGGILLRLALLLTLDNAEPRYTLELFPIVLVLGGAWLGRSTFFRRRSRACRGSRISPDSMAASS